jgi:hypothetical protein
MQYSLTNFQYQDISQKVKPGQEYDQLIWSFDLDLAVSTENELDLELATLTDDQYLPFKFTGYSGVQSGRKYIDFAQKPCLNSLSAFFQSQIGTFYDLSTTIPPEVLQGGFFRSELWASKDRATSDLTFKNSVIQDSPRFNVITHVDSGVIVGTFILNLADNGEVGTEFFSEDLRSVFKASGRKYSGFFFLNTRKARHHMFQTLHRDRFAIMGSLYPKGL